MSGETILTLLMTFFPPRPYGTVYDILFYLRKTVLGESNAYSDPLSAPSKELRDTVE